MHLPPEVEALLPGLLARVTARGPEPIDALREQELVEHLILTGDAETWLDYLRRAAALLDRADPTRADPEDHATIREILRDQFELIQAALDLGEADLETKRRLSS